MRIMKVIMTYDYIEMRAFITTESLETGPNHSCKCSSELFVYMHEKQIPMQE